MKNRSKNGVKMGRHLGIYFLWILVVFWRQGGRENGAKSDPRRHRKNDGKMEGTKMAEKSQQAVTRRAARGVQSPGEGVGGGVKLPTRGARKHGRLVPPA